VLLRLDQSSVNLGKTGVHQRFYGWPLAWKRHFGEGRVFAALPRRGVLSIRAGHLAKRRAGAITGLRLSYIAERNHADQPLLTAEDRQPSDLDVHPCFR
jgi:hypothetical protein